MEHHRRADCRLCAGTSLAQVLGLPPTPPANAFVTRADLDRPQTCYPLDVYFCETCKHLQLLDVVDPAILFRDYVYVSGTSPAFVRHFQDYTAELIARYAPPVGALAIDVGSNDGTLLRFFRQENLSVLGIEPALKIAADANAHGMETWPTFLDRATAEKVVAEKGHAVLITANNVFAHVDDLGSFTDNIRTILAPDGVFAFEVSYAGDVYRKVLFDTIYHEHLDYHTVGPLVSFFASRGMELFSVKRVATHGGSLRGYVQHAGGPHTRDRSVAALVEEERKSGLDTAATWSDFDRRIEQLGRQLTAQLRDLKGAGKRIAGFGAPAKATTLMYRFQLDRDMIDYIVDDSPLKQGLFTPGKHVPVVPWSMIETSWPDYLVVLAWNFAPQIVASHTSYAEAGGRFIVPLPEFTMI